MLGFFRAITLIAAIQWALRTISSSYWLKTYFRAQFIYTVVLGAILLLRAPSWIYEAAFTVLTVCVLAAAASFVWSCIRQYEVKWLILIQSLVLPNVLIVGAHNGLGVTFSVVPSYIWISLGESAILMTLGIALAHVAALEKRSLRVPAVTLSLLWLLQGAYEYGFTLDYHSNIRVWSIMNEFVPALLVCVAFFVIGWKQRVIE